jgi:hypothetical protein
MHQLQRVYLVIPALQFFLATVLYSGSGSYSVIIYMTDTRLPSDVQQD